MQLKMKTLVIALAVAFAAPSAMAQSTKTKAEKAAEKAEKSATKIDGKISVNGVIIHFRSPPLFSLSASIPSAPPPLSVRFPSLRELEPEPPQALADALPHRQA